MHQSRAPESTPKATGPTVADLLAAETDSRRVSSQPLYLRLYFQAAYIALARLIGYGSLPFGQAKRKLAAMSRKVGPAQLANACLELLEIDSACEPPVVRLKAEVRKLAFQMLGPPPESSLVAPVTPLTPAPPRDVVIPRNLAIERFTKWATESGLTVVAGEELRKVNPALKLLPPPDALLLRSRRRTLVVLSTRLLPRQAARLLAWRAALGSKHEAIRMWPVEGADGWEWREYAVEADPSAPPNLTMSDWSTVLAHRDADARNGKKWKSTDGCTCELCAAARTLA